MLNRSLCACGSGQAEDQCCKKSPEVRMFMQTFSHPNEHKEMLEKLQISSQFDMRYRGLFHFYGDDLIAYKRKKATGKHATEFLRILSNYLTDHLEDHCPPSWKDCTPAFWEEFIYACYPDHIRISTKQKESEIFLLQLKKFIRWLDQRTGCSWYELVERYAEEAHSELSTCEQVLNDLLFSSRIFSKGWDPDEHIAKVTGKLSACKHTVDSIFEVTHIADGIVTIIDIDSARSFQLVNVPTKKLIPGILLEGIIGKMRDDFYWTWHHTEGTYPQKAKGYII